MIILVTGHYPKYDRHGLETGDTEFIVSHGIDTDNNDAVVVLPQVHPSLLGATYSEKYDEWVLL